MRQRVAAGPGDAALAGAVLGRDKVLVYRALAVSDMYDELWRADPAEHLAEVARQHVEVLGKVVLGPADG
ncbi:hypothetical protein KMT30_50010, partial [Streptomyces sp. IBSBF 2953]|nr:hypothetical protein [Streptomyces hayashii]